MQTTDNIFSQFPIPHFDLQTTCSFLLLLLSQHRLFGLKVTPFFFHSHTHVFIVQLHVVSRFDSRVVRLTALSALGWKNLKNYEDTCESCMNMSRSVSRALQGSAIWYFRQN